MRTCRALGLILLATLCGCPPRRSESVRIVQWPVVDEGLASWTGRSAKDLVAHLGRPTSIESAAVEGDLYVYASIEVQTVEGGFQPIPSDPGETPGLPLMEERVVETRPFAKFWVDRDKVVYRQWIRPGLSKDQRQRLLPPP